MQRGCSAALGSNALANIAVVRRMGRIGAAPRPQGAFVAQYGGRMALELHQSFSRAIAEYTAIRGNGGRDAVEH